MTAPAPDDLSSIAARISAGGFREALDSLAALDHEAWQPADRGRALALEAVAKGRLSADPGAIPRFLHEVLDHVKPGYDMRRALAGQLMDLAEPALALPLLRELAAQSPADLPLRRHLARALAETHAWPEAADAWAHLARRDPDDAAAAEGLTHAAAAAGRAAEALAAARAWTALRPDDPGPWLARAALADDAEEIDDAFARAESLDPLSPDLWFRRARAAARSGEAPAAARAAMRLAEAASSSDWRREAARAFAAEAAFSGNFDAPAADPGAPALSTARDAFRRAFDLAMADDSEAARDAGIVECLDFHRRRALHDDANGAEAALHATADRLTEPVLAALRAVSAARAGVVTEVHGAAGLHDWFVLVTGEATVHASLAGAGAAAATGPSGRRAATAGEAVRPYARAYRVLAADHEVARAEALRFEAKAGGTALAVEECATMAPAPGELPGVRFRSGRVFFRDGG